MDTRDQFLVEFRGKTLGIITSQSTTEESFQNQVLRPILKLQNEIICSVFLQYLKKNKIDFNSFSIDKKLKTIDNAVQKDIKFRNSLKGIVIGLFTVAEYNSYAANTAHINKRIMSMLVERLKSQIQLLNL